MPVLDASALLAYLGDETGADIVADAISGGVAISTVNLGEALSTLATRGSDPAAVASELTSRGLLDGAITVEAFTAADAVETGRLRPLTRAAGLSLADRACLALARRLAASVLTADLAWMSLTLDVDVRAIRARP
jgi:ribonuclease VapC